MEPPSRAHDGHVTRLDPLPCPDKPLTDGRHVVRPWSDDDLDCVREAAADHRIPRGTTVPAVFTPAAGLAFITRQRDRARAGEGVSQCVAEAGSDRAVGLVWVGLRPQPRVAGLGYWVVPSARGRGAAGAGVRLVTPWALQALGLRRLEAWVEPDNEASQRVLLGAGYEREGRLRNFLTIGEAAVDAIVFSRIA